MTHGSLPTAVDRPLRLITWNASPGRLEEKLEALARFKPDIAVLQEISRPKSQVAGLVWSGRTTGGKGVALWLRPGLKARVSSPAESPWWSMPVFKISPLRLTLLNVWTREEHRFVEGLHGALDHHLPRSRAKNLIVAGDFNGNPIFRHDGSKRDFRTMVERLEQRYQLQSAYHSHTGDPFGVERAPTYYFQWNKKKPYHLDYCFLPRCWTVKRVEVGTYKEWGHLSDHVPVVVDAVRG